MFRIVHFIKIYFKDQDFANDIQNVSECRFLNSVESRAERSNLFANCAEEKLGYDFLRVLNIFTKKFSKQMWDVGQKLLFPLYELKKIRVLFQYSYFHLETQGNVFMDIRAIEQHLFRFNFEVCNC